MNKGLVGVAALLVFLVASGFTSVIALADTFNIIPYYATGSDGDWWQYQYTKLPVESQNPDFSPSFTVNQELLSSGIFSQGPWKLPNKTENETRFYRADATHLYLYDSSGNLTYTINGLVQLEEFIDSPFPGNTGMKAYFSRLSSGEVLAGTFSDILVYVVLDTSIPQNPGNTYLQNLLGMPSAAPGGVTRLSALARGVGEIINIDWTSEPLEAYSHWGTYELAAYSVHAPAPGTLILLGSGLCLLVFYGGRKLTARN